jgi:hypothetical protein
MVAGRRLAWQQQQQQPRQQGQHHRQRQHHCRVECGSVSTHMSR